jgi:hypothetical protein
MVPRVEDQGRERSLVELGSILAILAIASLPRLPCLSQPVILSEAPRRLIPHDNEEREVEGSRQSSLCRAAPRYSPHAARTTLLLQSFLGLSLGLRGQSFWVELPKSVSRNEHPRDVSTRPQSPASRDPSYLLNMTAVSGWAGTWT